MKVSAADNAIVAKILIVDDEPDLREIIADQLHELKLQADGVSYVLEIHHAQNGKDAIDKVAQIWFDAILTDINMPEMSGIELLAELRSSGNDVPVAMLTGYGDKAKSVEALRLGCYAFVDKPWRGDALRRILTGATEKGIALREAGPPTGSISIARPPTAA